MGEIYLLNLSSGAPKHTLHRRLWRLKKNLNAPRLSEHSPVRGKECQKRLDGIIGSKDKTSSWHLIGFPNGSNIELKV